MLSRCFLFALVTMMIMVTVHGQQCSDYADCKRCENPGPSCEHCPEGTVQSQDKYDCIDCAEGCGVCHVIGNTSSTTCDHCKVGYYMDYFGDCQDCGFSCSNCSLNVEGYPVCHECRTYIGPEERGFYQVKQELSCRRCQINAEMCEDDGTGDPLVTQCAAGWIISNDAKTCIICSSLCTGCDIEDGQVGCTACRPNRGLFLLDRKCTTCTAYCDTCLSDTECETCRAGYREEGGICIECPPYCSQCDELECLVCQERYGTKAGVSVTCDACTLSNCNTCSYDNAGSMICSLCASGYGKDANGYCQACPLVGCTECEYKTDHWACTECDTPTYSAAVYPAFSASTLAEPALCAVCTDADPECTACDFNSGTLECSDCTSGYFLDESGALPACKELSYSCAEGDPATGNCLTCKSGFSMYSNQCVRCGASRCKTCSVNLLECDTCNDNYLLLDTDGDGTEDACQACRINRCIQCIPNGNKKLCTECQPKSVIYNPKNPSTVQGTACRECPTNCDVCQVNYVGKDTYECLTCAAWNGAKAYVVDGSLQCTDCPDNCMDCDYDTSTGSTVCVAGECTTGYTEDPSGQCIECPEFCDGSCVWLDSVSDVMCLGCQTSYGVITDGKCAECPAHCATCEMLDPVDSPDDLTCTSCLGGFGSNQATCGACPAHCLSCEEESDSMICKLCEQGYTVDDNNVCVTCLHNCIECNSLLQCETCRTGFARSPLKSACISCNDAATPFCADCEDLDDILGTSVCYKCAEGYVLEDMHHRKRCINALDLQCDLEYRFDLGPQCAECEAPYSLDPNGNCTRMCQVCGDVANGVYMPLDKCNDADYDGTGPLGVHVKYCRTRCYMAIDENKELMAGCDPVDELSNGCSEIETCRDASAANRCDLCCQEALCNDLRHLDGVGDGASSISVSAVILIMAACVHSGIGL